MSLRRGIYIGLIALLPLWASAQPFKISPESDVLFKKALPYLQKANEKLEAMPRNEPTASAEEKQRAMALTEEAGQLFNSAVPLLKKAAKQDHPVAQYQLSLIYVMIEPVSGAPEKVCPLIKQSAIHGFAPAVLEATDWCPEFAQTVEYQDALASVMASWSMYERYYPQPAIMFECRREAPTGISMPSGSSQDFRAEIYRLLGDRNRAKRAEYYQKAIDINDCFKAKRRTTSKG